MKTNLFRNMLAATVALFTVMFALPQKAMAENYDLTIAGVSVTSDNCNDLSVIPGVSGTVKYDPDTKTLTLDNATIDTNDPEAVRVGVPLNIYLKGKNKIEGAGCALWLYEDTRISGDGTATLEMVGGHEDGVYLVQQERPVTFEIKDCTVSIESFSKYAIAAQGGALGIQDATLKVKGHEGAIANLGEMPAIAEPYEIDGGYDFFREGPAYILGNWEAMQNDDEYIPIDVWVTIKQGKATVVEAYDLVIGGEQVTSANCNDISASNGFPAVKSGTVSYDPATRTLTLDNAVIEMVDGNVIWFIDEDMSHAYTLVLKGNDNRLSAINATLPTRSNLTITGGGSAQITSSDDCGILVKNGATLTITGGCNVTAEGLRGIAGWNGSSETLIIDGATVKAKGTAGSVCDFKEIQLKNCAITAPSGATVEGGNVMLNGEVCKEQVVIEPKQVEAYGLRIAGVQVTSANCNDLSVIPGVSGTVSYAPATRTLTLDNAVIEMESGNAVITFVDEDMSHAYTLVLKGNNKLTTNDKSAMGIRANLTITGGGSAEMTSGYNCGILVDMDATLTITGGCSITAEGTWGISGQNGSSETLIIDGATVKAKGNGTGGSVCDFKEITLKNCAITAPSGATVENGSVKLNGSVCTEQVVIEPTANGIDAVNTASSRAPYIYNVQGVRLGTSLDTLPAGVYIIDGKKVIKR